MLNVKVQLNPMTVLVFLVEEYGGGEAGWIGKGKEMILGTGWDLGRRVKLKYSSEDRQGGVAVKGIRSGEKILETR
jgi:hypothetical protein